MILVTGASGTVGSVLVEELQGSGDRVRAAHHSPSMARERADAGLDAVAIDMADPATLPPALDAVRSVFLVGAMSPHQTENELAVVDAAEAAGVERVVKLSVWRADERLTPIAQLHRPVEERLEASTLAWTFLRPNFYMQNFSRQSAHAIKTSGTISQPAAQAAISFVDARDVAHVAAHVLRTVGHDGRTYDLTGPQALTYDEVAGTFAAVLGRPVRFAPLSEQQAREGMLGRGLSPFYADALIEVSAAYRDGGAERITTTVADLTGRQACTLARFIADHRSAFR